MSTNYKTINQIRKIQSFLINKSKAFMLGLFLLVATAASASVELLVTGSANVASIQSGDQFIYSVNYSVSSFVDVGHNVVIDIALPASLEITDESTPSNSIVYDPSQVASVSYISGTRTLHITMVEPIPAGSTGQLQVRMRYKNGVTPNGYNPGITTKMDASNNINSVAQGGGTGPITSNTTNVVAIATNLPSVSKQLTAGGAVDNLAIFKITANNGGSSGSLNLNSPVLRDTLPAGSTFVKATRFSGSNAPTTYAISGGRTVVEWTWSAFLATGYSSSAYLNVLYTSPTFSIGSTITNCATLQGTVNTLPYITQAAQAAQGCTTFNIAAPNTAGACNGGYISASTAWWMDHHVLAGTDYNAFGNGWYNSGNTELDAVSLTYHIDEAVDLQDFRVYALYDGSDDPAQAQITVSYKTNLNGYVTYGTYLSLDIYSGASPYSFSPPSLPVGEYVTDMKFDIAAYGGFKLPIGGHQDLTYYGHVRTAAQGKKNGSPIVEGTTYNPSNIGDDGTTITNHSEGTYTYNSTTTAWSNCDGVWEILSPRPVFYPLTKYTTNGSSFKASEIVNYEARFYVGGNATANNIVIKDTLDARLIYQDGTSEYYNGSSWVAITPTVTAFGSQQILTYTIGNVTPVLDEYLRFQAQVKPGTLPGTIPNRLEVTTTTANNLFSGLTDYANVTVISAVALQVKKGQIGNCLGDPNNYVYYPTIAHTLPGGNVKYKVTIKNLGNVVAKDFIMYDVFPFTSDYRGSSFFANLTTPGTVDDVLSTVYYTTTPNPCYDELVPAITPTGCNTPVWTSVIPVDLTTVKGIKLMRSADLPIFDSITLSWDMKAPVGVPFGNIMNNSVSYQVSRADNGNQLLPATPNQVGMVADCINPIGSLGNYVWLDKNKNGLQDEAASDGLNGIKVYLLQDNGSGTFVKVDSTVTGSDFSGNPGYYLFPSLHTGDYKVQFQTTALDGYSLTTPVNQASQVDGNSDANTTTGFSGIVHIDENGTGVNKDNMTIDAGYNTIGSLGNYVWFDDNENGLQDEAANRGINGVKVYLYKDNGTGTFVKIDSTITTNDLSGNPGYYNFVISLNGNYQVEFPTNVGNTDLTTQNNSAGVNGNSDPSVSTGRTSTIVMDIYSTGVAKNNPTIDAGYKPLGTLGNYVWLDDNNNGIQDEPAANGVNGVKVYLYKDNGSGTFVVVDSTITANDSTGKSGWYTFYRLNNGNYKVLFPTMIGNYPISDVTNQAMQTDLNNDANKTTGYSGVVTINVAAGGLNKDNPTIDAGYRTNIGSLGNYVWRDFNGNGLQDDALSYGFNGVKVYLLNNAGTKIDSTITTNDGSGNPGYYNFSNLNSGNYQVLFPTIFAGYPLTPIVNQAMQVDGNQDADFTTGKSGVVTINTNSNNPLDVNNPTIDAGYGLLGTLGNYVWYDDNNNGLQDEPASNGVNGVKVILYKETTPGSGVYVKYDSTTTANDGSGNPGYYNFKDLYTANYKVQFPTMVGNYPISDVTNQAMQVDGNNDANKTTGFSGVVAIDVTTGGLNRDNPTIDAGYRRNIGSLGNYVWLDTNNDGIQNEPASNGVNGVKVYLLNGAGTKIDSTVTANDGSGNLGYYNFPNLLSGTYSVQFPTNIGNYPISDVTNQAMQTDGNNDANKVTGKSGAVVINTSSSNPLDVNNPTIDAGYRTNIGSLGNYVWYDVNGDGLNNDGATNGINGIKVYLLDGAGTKIDSTITANDGSGNPGYYNFPNLNSGNYQVQFPTTSGGFNLTNQTTTPQTDGNSDAAIATGKSPVVAIITNSSNPLDVNNPTIDAGYVPVGTLGNYVWYDANKNGLQDEPTANGLNDIKVILYKETTPGVYVKVDSMLTKNDSLGKSGWYTFYNLVKGNYKVQFPTSEGSYYLTPTNNQAPTTDGNNDANSAGFSGIVPLNPLAGGILKDNPTIDAGYYCDCNGFEVKIVKNKSFDCIQGNSFTFSANINRTGGKYFYSWDFGDGTTSTLANPTHTYATAGEYDVKLTVVENSFCGCRYEASVNQVYVGPKPVVAWDFQYNGNCLTYDFNSNSTVTMGWIAGFYWDFGNGTTSTQSNPLATFSTPGIYNVKLVVTTNYGCKDSLTIAVNIINKCNYLPCPAIGAINGATSICVGGTTTLTDTTSAGTWASSNTSVATINGAGLVTALSAGSTTISYTVVKPCGTTVAYKTITVYANVAQPITGIDSVCIGQNITLSNANTGGVYTASNNNATINNSGNVLGVTAGLDTITYTITTPCGTFTNTKVIKVSDACSVSSGGSGGVESKTLGDVIAVRLYGNAINSVSTTANTGVQFANSGAIVNGANNLKLSDLVPVTVANTDAAYVTTPTDLVNFTNAVEVLAVDYSKGNSTKAVAFGTKTLGDVYSHTKPICDRLKGAELQEVKNITVNGFNLMAYKVRQRTGETEYAINLSAGTAASRNSISLQSNWFTDSYQQDEKLYNFQLWAVSYEMVTAMAKDIISKLQANGAVNTVTNADLPKAYISKGSRKGTDLTVTVNNNTAATSGYFELHEKANENAATTTRQVAFTVAANGATNVTIPVRDNYEGDVYVYLNNKLTDLVYLADGTWNLDYNKSTTTISKFDVVNESNLTTNNNEMRLLRNVAVTGVSKDYITIYKTMMGGGLEQNVTAYNGLLFNANATGAGKVQVTLVKKSITNWKEQYTYTMDLDGDKEYGINLNQFASTKFNSTINANDITAVNFSFSNSRGVTTTMTINLNKVRFSNAAIATELTAQAINVYPNPTNGKFNVSFSNEVAQPLVLKVVETATGKTVKTQFINAAKGINQTVVILDNILSTNGLYIVTLEGDNTKYNAAKLMINKK